VNGVLGGCGNCSVSAQLRIAERNGNRSTAESEQFVDASLVLPCRLVFWLNAARQVVEAPCGFQVLSDLEEDAEQVEIGWVCGKHPVVSGQQFIRTVDVAEPQCHGGVKNQ